MDAKRDVREELAEQRKQLKELLDAGAASPALSAPGLGTHCRCECAAVMRDGMRGGMLGAHAEKEERKRKREERRAEEEKAAAEAAAAAGPAGDGDAPTAEQQQTQQRQPQQAEEPSFELPERLREFTGASGDKKALVQWRHEQQAEKRRLDKERNKWMAEQLRRQRELEATEKAAVSGGCGPALRGLPSAGLLGLPVVCRRAGALARAACSVRLRRLSRGKRRRWRSPSCGERSHVADWVVAALLCPAGRAIPPHLLRPQRPGGAGAEAGEVQHATAAAGVRPPPPPLLVGPRGPPGRRVRRGCRGAAVPAVAAAMAASAAPACDTAACLPALRRAAGAQSPRWRSWTRWSPRWTAAACGS